jgi:hypothetical protein
MRRKGLEQPDEEEEKTTKKESEREGLMELC